MSQSAVSNSDVVLVLAPVGRDSQLIAGALAKSEIQALEMSGMGDLCRRLQQHPGRVVVTEEALQGPPLSQFVQELSTQPAWSDLPIIILSTGAAAGEAATWNLVKKIEPGGNVSLLERPIRSMTLVSAVQVALRSRRRQYEVRSLYEEMEARVERRTSELIAMNQELEGFTYSVSHDMRAPLRAIVAKSHMLLEDEADRVSEEGKLHLERLSMAAVKMAQLLDDLLAYSRTGKRELTRDTVNLGELVCSSGVELAGQYPGLEVIISSDEPPVADCDPLLIGMALQNLLENACKYAKQGVPPVIRFGAERREGQTVFYMRDNGIGFDMQYVGKLFQPFERLHREEYAGTGIGLANVRRAIERHGGRVWAEGELGKGSTFYFTLG